MTALACDSASCTLLAAATADDEELVPIDEAPFPAGLRALGFTGAQGRLCAHTDSELYCNDGEGWYAAVQPEPPSPFRQVGLNGAAGMAVTEDGRLWVRREGTWAEELPGFESPVERVTVSSLGFAAMGSSGELAISSGATEADWLHLCTDPAPARLAWVADTNVPAIRFMLTAEGFGVLLEPLPYAPPRNSTPAWCLRWQLDLDTHVGTGQQPCGAAGNTIQVTESTLFAFGSFACITT